MKQQTKDVKVSVDSDSTQLDRFKQAARDLGTDDDPERFKAMVRKVAKSSPSKHAEKPKSGAER